MRADGARRGRWRAWTLSVAMGLGLTAADASAQPTPKQGAPGKPAAAAPAAAAAAPPATAPAAAAPPQQLPLEQALTGMAKAEFVAGDILFQQGDHRGAVERFMRAHELSRDFRLLWRVALCHQELRRYARMLKTLDQLEAEAGAALSAQDRADIAALRAFAQNLVSRLEILTGEPGAIVFVDDEDVGTTPLPQPVPLDIGERRIRISKPGFKDASRTEKVVGGGQIALAIPLERVDHRGRLRVVAGPNDLISLDGKMVGKGTWEGLLPSGSHALRVIAPGKVAHRSNVLVQDGEARRVDVTLLEKQPNRTSWLWIGGGAALLAGALLAGALVFEPGRPVEQGTLGSCPLPEFCSGGVR